MGIFLSLREDNSFHTLIIKKSVGEYVYLVALGYEGGRTYGEFYSKLKYDENDLEAKKDISNTKKYIKWLFDNGWNCYWHFIGRITHIGCNNSVCTSIDFFNTKSTICI